MTARFQEQRDIEGRGMSKEASAYLHYGNLLHASFAGFTIVIANLVDAYYFAQYSGSCRAEAAESFC
jgi:hypothetical protein